MNSDKMEDVHAPTPQLPPADVLGPGLAPSPNSLLFSPNNPVSSPLLAAQLSNSASTLTPPLSPSPAIPTTSSSSIIPQFSHQQITQLIDDLRSNDLIVRLNSFKNIKNIANALGPVRTRDELIPYLNEFCDDDDEVLLSLSNTLGEMIEFVGGHIFAHTLIPPLEQLAGTEEAAVRDKAVASLCRICESMGEAAALEHVFPLLKRLAGQEWFTSRISACGLFATLYGKSQNVNIRKELRGLFIKLCADETPMVRRAATGALGNFCVALDYTVVKAELFPAFSKLTKDDQDSVRLLTVPALIPIAKMFKPADNVTKMLPTVFSLCGDKSWRVRYMVADKFCEIAESIGGAEAKSDDLVDGFVKLLQDEEAEVRTAAAAKVGDVAKLVGAAQTLKKLLTPLKNLVKDTSPYTRAALGSVIMSIASVLKKKEVVDHLLPLFLTLLKDTTAEVRLNIISKLDLVNESLSIDMLSQSLLPAIAELAQDPKWRVRQQIIQHIPHLAKNLGHEFFDAKLSDLCMEWLGDSVWSIREEATGNLTKLAEVFGESWALQNIIPKIAELGNNKSYLFRMTAVFAIKDMAKILGPVNTTAKLLPVLINLANDSVPNVRFNCARVIGALLTSRGIVNQDDSLKKIDETLKKLAQDTDADVKYYAEQSQESLESFSKSI